MKVAIVGHGNNTKYTIRQMLENNLQVSTNEYCLWKANFDEPFIFINPHTNKSYDGEYIFRCPTCNKIIKVQD